MSSATWASDLSNLPSTKTHIEFIAEADEVSNLTGFHLITTLHTPNTPFDTYFGGGVVYVELPDENDAFLAIHAVTGINIKLIQQLALNFEFGFDLGEEIISGNDRGSPTFNGEESNEIDYSLSAGIQINLDKSFYVKTYARYHVFDGVFLPPTEVTFIGARLGLAF